MTERRPVRAKEMPPELVREIANAQGGLAARLYELFLEHTRAAYQVGYENGWNAGWAASEGEAP